MGMTDMQFKALMLYVLDDLKKVKKTAEKENAKETAEIAQAQIDKINEVLKM